MLQLTFNPGGLTLTGFRTARPSFDECKGVQRHHGFGPKGPTQAEKENAQKKKKTHRQTKTKMV